MSPFITQENNEWHHGRHADVGSDDYNRFVQSKQYRETNCSDQLNTPDRNDAHEHTKCDRECFEFIALVPTVNMLIKKRLHFFSVEQIADTISLFDIQKRDDQQKCMVWCEQIYVMLMSHETFKEYSRKLIPDTKNYAAAYFTLPVESLDRVNEIVDSGLKAGGNEPIPMTEEGFMQIRKMIDFDGHTWDIIFMDLSKFKKDYNQITPIEYIKRKKRKITKVILPSMCFLSVVC